MSKKGMLAKLTKKQTEREYFSDLPIGTFFIIVGEIDLPGYDLTGYFIGVNPVLPNGICQFTGYIEKGSWELIGEIKDNLHHLTKSINF